MVSFFFLADGKKKAKENRVCPILKVLLKIILLSTVGQFGKLSPSLNDRKKA